MADSDNYNIVIEDGYDYQTVIWNDGEVSRLNKQEGMEVPNRQTIPGLQVNRILNFMLKNNLGLVDLIRLKNERVNAGIK